MDPGKNDLIEGEELPRSESTWIGSVETIVSVKSWHIGFIHEAPDYVVDNEYILKGYRINFETCKNVTKSICMCHNETVNIWSHLVGAAVVIYFMIATLFIEPYGSGINNQQMYDREKINQDFEAYTVPFFESKAYLHNTRIVLSSLTGGGGNPVLANKLLETSITYFDSVYQKIDDKFPGNIDCFWCIEDFMKNMYAIDDQISGAGEADGVVLRLKTTVQKVINLVKAKSANLLKDEMKDLDQNGSITLTRFPIFIQLITAMICLMCSSMFHLCLAFNERVINFLSRLDYAGISLLIAGSCYPPYYYFFYCNAGKHIYITI
jgi:adiponectin receptor